MKMDGKYTCFELIKSLGFRHHILMKLGQTFICTTFSMNTHIFECAVGKHDKNVEEEKKRISQRMPNDI